MTIPAPVAATVADVLADRYTHPELNLLFMEAGAPGDPPAGTKLVKCQEWLRRIRDDAPADALSILGRLLERFMEEVLPSEEEIAAHPAWAGEHWAVDRKRKRDRVRAALANAGLAYVRWGIITRGGAHAMRPDLARNYRIEPRHARLVVNAALALTVFLIEAWDTAEARRRA
ncbi:MAG: hypothetical protein QJR07_13680 [Acetobacteraceae bacterium]|nr:hypothetical protein [Acetobacteraceae bacterium]